LPLLKFQPSYIGSNLDQLYNRERGTCSGALARGIAVQAGRSLFRFLMASLGFFIYIILPSALCPWGLISL